VPDFPGHHRADVVGAIRPLRGGLNCAHGTIARRTWGLRRRLPWAQGRKR
jgi:hypothetical protein